MNIFTTVVGSHMWGMEHDHSDVDIYTCYADDITAILSGKNIPNANFKQYKNFDVTTIEISHLIGGLIKSNPNYIYSVTTPIVIFSSKYHKILKYIVEDTISLEIYKPIRGLAIHNYKKYIENGLDISQKRLKTVARTIQFGCDLFDTGEIEFKPFIRDITADDISEMLNSLERAYERNSGKLPKHTDEEPYRNWLVDLRENMVHEKFRLVCR